jgi:hypothetical protein
MPVLFIPSSFPSLPLPQHRYYGKSQPYGPDSVTTNPDVFSVQQAMAGELLPAC